MLCLRLLARLLGKAAAQWTCEHNACLAMISSLVLMAAAAALNGD
jgi:hypothetical protein